MKPFHFLFLAAIGALSSCGSMNDPIYYSDGETEAKQTSPQNTAAVEPVNTQIQVVAAAAASSKKPQELKNTGPFMQPDVFAMPKNEDLEETATSTRSNSGSPGLTVPSQ